VGRRPGAKRPSWIWVAVVTLVAGTFIYVGVGAARRVAFSARLPKLPELSGQTPAVRAHLTQADRAARANPTSAEMVGSLGLAYHADMFYDQA